ncbi:hypothetical protein F8M41_001633 [Gigaspora margarita]|uniref:Uncharacterized protein n=1 Tax=Gigaspora margarita TaxID=4874 RepID=A0A8H4ESF3_GIGMA|nr:hypothetical protein F8M41_001633 [Gigaspora margarita]
MTERTNLPKNDTEQVEASSKRSIMTGISFDFMQLEMSDYVLDNEINQEVISDFFNFLPAKNNKGKGKATQKADNRHIPVELIDQLFLDDNIEDN